MSTGILQSFNTSIQGCFNAFDGGNSSDIDACSMGAGAVAVVGAIAAIAPALTAAAPAAAAAAPAAAATPAVAATPMAAGVASGGAGANTAPIGAFEAVLATPVGSAIPAIAGAVGAVPAAIGVAGAFAVGVGATTAILFTIDQITRIEDSPGCREATIESCAKVDLTFDTFDRTISIFGTSFERRLESELDFNTKFFEVNKLYNIINFFSKLEKTFSGI